MANEKIVNVTDATFPKEVLESNVPVIVDFWAPWCGPCKMIAPVIEELATDFEGKVKVCKLNVDDNNHSAGQNGVMSIPTMVIFNQGKEVNRLVGFMPKEQIAKVLEELV